MLKLIWHIRYDIYCFVSLIMRISTLNKIAESNSSSYVQVETVINFKTRIQ